ncbi:uncharacterized protein LOC124143788 isoform X1 [Haliotis rufescens]|uniref:uncharacterized protein LOC124143788 isoform X1 n=1 Tax=Haliotis rufescens TaxID=6454 RepID=UPI00201E9E57|nr:uncharacterized protein LOC124143788 isoform X1 [Haliotis rufescens]
MTSSKIGRVESLHYPSGLRVTFLHGDITLAHATAVVTGENQDFLVESSVTKALIQKSKAFEHLRNKLRQGRLSNDLWTVYPAFLGMPFTYVLFAFLERMDGDEWMKGMKYLYKDIFKTVENLDIATLAIPLLGAGVVKREDSAIIAAARSSVKYKPSKRREIIFFASSFDRADKMVTQWKHELHEESTKGILFRFVSTVKDAFEVAPPDRIHERPRRNSTRHDRDKPVSQSKKQGHPKASSMTKNESLSLRERENIDRAIAESLEAETKRRNSTKRDHRPRRYGQYGNQGHSARKASYREGMFRNFQEDNSVWENTTDEEMRVTEMQASSDADTVPSSTTEDDSRSISDSENMLTCAICLGVIIDLKQLDKCYHIFCKSCIDRSFREHKPVCPTCNMVYGVIKGNQPDGTMKVVYNSTPLSGYEDWGSIQINYDIPSGIQTTGQPDPGMAFKGITRRAYLPACPEGKDILRLLRIAFDRKLTFTVGRSTTTGRENVVTWNDIHHKTNMDGGPTRFGYPDPTYLTRVRDELASKGVTADNV